MIHGVLARSAAAAMPPAAPMQRKAILRSIITVRAALPMLAAIAVLRLLMLMLGLTAGDERGQAVDVALVFRAGMLRPRLKMLLRLLRLIVRLIVLLLLARIIRLGLTWREWFAADMRLFTIALVVALLGAAHLARLLLLLLVIWLTLPELLLRRGDDPEIVFGVLIIIFGCNRIAGALCVTSELKVLFSDVRRGSANFYVRPIGLIHSRQWILMMPTFAVATAHALVLTVSHGLLFRQPPLIATAPAPPLLSNSPHASDGEAPLEISVSFSALESSPNSQAQQIAAEFQCRLPRANDVRAKPMKRRDPSTI